MDYGRRDRRRGGTCSRLAYFARLGERMVEGRRPAAERVNTLAKTLDLLTERH